MDAAPLTFLVLMALVLALGIGLALAAHAAERRRREALFALASRLGLRFDASRDPGLAARYAYLKALAKGENRYFFNSLAGRHRGEEVLVSDYHYEITTTNSKGHRQTHHHYLSVFALSLPKAFPELTIAKEGFMSKIAQSLGYEDIDFESHEFSRSFCVRSRDKKFAYDVCNARMIDYLLGNKDLSIEIDRDTLALVFPSKLKLERAESDLARLLEIRARLPHYLFA